MNIYSGEADGDLVKLDSQSACHAFIKAVALCSSFPRKLREYGHLEATCGITEKGGCVLPSPRDAKGYPTIRLRYITSVPISILLSERYVLLVRLFICHIWL